ncbi:O-antigen ligase family protein [uncultured Cohaesibacter sp.]|uniref:O-antigen ligase family protein n=1 Tax=uncultured Cohaesibacter sp. TaxID=1002546 RepID=UPI00292D5530|nr:O-antigen ligase family protein [uncultured Cohaesibacter sp.]
MMTRRIETLLRLWLFSICIFTLIGNAASDIWLTGTVVLFIGHSVMHGNTQWLSFRWFQIALIFWIWIIVASLLSSWPVHSLEDSAGWIRFPLFALALSYFLEYVPGARRYVLVALCVGLAVMLGSMLHEKILDPSKVRLYGTWNQNTKAGWLMLGFGLPVSFWALKKVLENTRSAFWALPLVAMLLSSAILTGEVYVSIEFIFGLALFLLASGMRRNVLISVLVICFALVVLVFVLDPELVRRFQVSIVKRLPWMSTSDYYVPWMRGFMAGEMHPVFGIGPKNHQLFCTSTEALRGLSKTVCYPHPHNLYIQIFAETGAIGLLLFLAMVVAIFAQVLNGAKRRHEMSREVIAALCILIAILWPISTYSHAFGQHKNFFTWLNIAWALYLAGQFKTTSRGEAASEEQKAG